MKKTNKALHPQKETSSRKKEEYVRNFFDREITMKESVKPRHESYTANENRKANIKVIQIVPCKLNHIRDDSSVDSFIELVCKNVRLCNFYTIIFRIFTLNLHTEFSFLVISMIKLVVTLA